MNKKHRRTSPTTRGLGLWKLSNHTVRIRRGPSMESGTTENQNDTGLRSTKNYLEAN